MTTTIRVKIEGWCFPSTKWCEMWRKMTPNKSLQVPLNGAVVEFCDSEPCDLYLVINSRQDRTMPPPHLSIVFQMEVWAQFERSAKYLYLGSYDRAPHVAEWHLAASYDELLTTHPTKTNGHTISTILSALDHNYMYKHRVAFARRLDETFQLDKFGADDGGWRNYKGSLPLGEKDAALMPYKYTFNCENAEVPNYATEKLYDGIFSECLVFYMGCPNTHEFIDSRAFVQLPVNDTEGALEIVRKCLENDEYERRLPFIRAEKDRIIRKRSPLMLCAEIIKKI